MTVPDPPEYEQDDEPDKDYDMTTHFIAHCQECGALPPGIGGSVGCKPSCTEGTRIPPVDPDVLLAVLDALRNGINNQADAYKIGAICGMYSRKTGVNARTLFDLSVAELEHRGMLRDHELTNATQLIEDLWAYDAGKP